MVVNEWAPADLEIWGGHEYTVNRVGDVFHDQTVRSGHQWRGEDLDLFAGLGLKVLRYPVLWERVIGDTGRPDWNWTDARLKRIADLGMRPIVGLTHHGSGPRFTNLLDDGFAPGLARFARAAAERYPHVTDWTPVNEPLTTARFSALYGKWFPHRADEPSFWLALLNQIDAIRLSMREIRAVNPCARLIQTEDLGRTYSTAATSGQAAHDNERRWMTWDLLCGRVMPTHPFWSRLEKCGLADRLRAIADDPCVPDVIGVNHYLTSDRFLDDRCSDYPVQFAGGNQTLAFADVEAIRVVVPPPGGLERALQDAWTRYGLRLAVTECHLGCTREEQTRWLSQAWRTVVQLRARGLRIEALTAWSLLGSFDWNSLLTQTTGHYESGAFDVCGPAPRPTALARTIESLARHEGQTPMITQGQGWWRRDIRLLHRPVFRSVQDSEPRMFRQEASPAPRPILILGATGTLGKAFARSCDWRGLDYVLTDRSMLALNEPDGFQAALEQYQPWAVINAAGWVRVDDAEDHPDLCAQINAVGSAKLAQACCAADVAFVGFSSDLVFDGRKDAPYDEGDLVNPLNAYGHSKAQGDEAVARLGGKCLMVRTAGFFSPFDPYNFAADVLRKLGHGQPVMAADDLVVSPTYVPDLVDAVLDLTIDGELGLWHLANGGAVTWSQFAQMIAVKFGYPISAIAPRSWRDLGWKAERPANVALASRRGTPMPRLEDALNRYAQALQLAPVAASQVRGRHKTIGLA